MTHTPGPWEMDDELDIYQKGATGFPIALLCDHHREWEANARLIAAAPDMLAALKECTLQLQYYLADNFGPTGTGAAVLARVESAIAKATGAS